MWASNCWVPRKTSEMVQSGRKGKDKGKTQWVETMILEEIQKIWLFNKPG